MPTPQQFLESFLEEKAAVYAAANVHLRPVYARHFGEPLAEHTSSFMLPDRAQVDFEDVRAHAGSALVIVREHFRPGDIRSRYHLAGAGDTWKIVGIHHECIRCRGTGQSEGAKCPRCDGEGWYNPRRKAA